MSDEEPDQEDDHPNDVADNDIVSDDIDYEYITENDIDDDVDMSDPFNDSDSKLEDDTYVELDEKNINDIVAMLESRIWYVHDGPYDDYSRYLFMQHIICCICCTLSYAFFISYA